MFQASVFHALIFNTYGGMGRDCEAFNRRSRLAQPQLISEKRKVSFSSVLSHIRTRLRFALLAVKKQSDIVERSTWEEEWFRNERPS